MKVLDLESYYDTNNSMLQILDKGKQKDIVIKSNKNDLTKIVDYS